MKRGRDDKIEEGQRDRRGRGLRRGKGGREEGEGVDRRGRG